MTPELQRVADWMRWWAPEVKKRIERGETVFAEARDAYEAVRKAQTDSAVIQACLDKMAECTKILDQAPPGAYDYLAHIGTYIP